MRSKFIFWCPRGLISESIKKDNGYTVHTSAPTSVALNMCYRVVRDGIVLKDDTGKFKLGDKYKEEK